MQSKYKVVVGSLVGAVAIHATFVACGGSIRQGGDGSGGSDGGLFDAVVDVISDVVGGETRDAVAAVDAGNGNDGGTVGDDSGTIASDGGACGCTVSLSGPVHSIPASENSAQLRSGSLTGVTSAGAIAVTGPFILTDATTDSFNNGAGVTLVIQPAGATCPALATNAPGYIMTIAPPGASGLPAGPNAHSARYLIPAGQMLCVYPQPTQPYDNGSLQWAGFVPYQ